MHGYDFHKAFTKILINIRGFWVKGLGLAQYGQIVKMSEILVKSFSLPPQ